MQNANGENREQSAKCIEHENWFSVSLWLSKIFVTRNRAMRSFDRRRIDLHSSRRHHHSLTVKIDSLGQEIRIISATVHSITPSSQRSTLTIFSCRLPAARRTRTKQSRRRLQQPKNKRRLLPPSPPWNNFWGHNSSSPFPSQFPQILF